MSMKGIAILLIPLLITGCSMQGEMHSYQDNRGETIYYEVKNDKEIKDKYSVELMKTVLESTLDSMNKKDPAIELLSSAVWEAKQKNYQCINILGAVDLCCS